MLLQDDAKISCHHEWLCFCTWRKAVKHNGNSPLQIDMGYDKWVPEEMCDVVVKKFESSPVALIPHHGYA